MWNGVAHIGEGWLIYRGVAADQQPHAHVAVQIALAEVGVVSVELDQGRIVEGDTLIIAPMTRHRLHATKSAVTLIYLEPRFAFAQQVLAAIDPDRAAQAPRDVAEVLRQTDWDAPHMAQILEKGAEGLDGRLERMLAEAVRSSKPGTVARAAKASGLSPQRARALAQAQLGAPISRLLLWRKLERAGREIACGASLAAAADAGGFADQAHLARTMRRMFGVTPGDAAEPLRPKL